MLRIFVFAIFRACFRYSPFLCVFPGRSFPRRAVIAVGLAVVIAGSGVGGTVRGQAGDPAFADPAFARVWRRTDAPVRSGVASRSWVWGPEPRTGATMEPYREAPGGQRLVQYFDKSRMEMNDPRGDANAPFFVTNGLLVTELVTGNLQLGDTAFVPYPPSIFPVAGDLDDPNCPTYAAFARVRTAPALAVGTPVTATLSRDGTVGADAGLAGQVTARQYVRETGHTVADVFWVFMNASGPTDGGAVEPLFRSPFYATGLPLTEAYWAVVRVGGQPRPVLMQLFERRVLTYTPANAPGFLVEAGNVGQHYRLWRAGLPTTINARPADPTPVVAPPTLVASTAPPTPTAPAPANPTAATPAAAPRPNERPTLAALIVEVIPVGAAGNANGERITLVNGGDRPLDLRDWTLRDTRGHLYRFGAFTLPVDGSVSLLSGKGEDNATTRHWNQPAPILNENGPETITLRDAAGTLVDSYPYP